MAQIPYRANVQSLAFPLLSTLSGQTVIDGQADQTYFPQVSTDGAVPVDRGIPQAFYAHNVMPSTYGWQSVGYKTIINYPADGAMGFTQALPVRGASVSGDTITPLSVLRYISLASLDGGSSYQAYVTQDGIDAWQKIANGNVNVDGDTVISIADVNGYTYICFSGFGTYVYNPFTDTLHKRTLRGLNDSEILGITSSNGYLLAWTYTSVAWSSPVDVEDFEPSDVSGAGGGSVQEAKGLLVTAVPTSLGFILYTRGNAVSVTFSGNETFPWNFKAIPGSGGITSPFQVSQRDISGSQYAYTSYGLQKVWHQKAETAFPSITDFLAGTVFEDFDSATNTFTQQILTVAMRKRVATISDRYLVISYGIAHNLPSTHAIVIDVAQSRYGKLKCLHTLCYERLDSEPDIVETARESIAMLAPDGQVKVVDFSPDADVTDAVLLLGKYQVQRTYGVQLQELEVENVKQGDTFEALALPSVNGKTFEPAVPGYLAEEAELSRRYLFSGPAGKNVSILFKGRFNLISVVCWFSLHGRM